MTEVPRRVSRRLVALVVLLLAWITAGVVLLGHPHVDPPRTVDALQVVGPAGWPTAERLIREGRAGWC